MRFTQNAEDEGLVDGKKGEAQEVLLPAKPSSGRAIKGELYEDPIREA